MQTKEWWNTELKGIVPDSLGDGVWPISEQADDLLFFLVQHLISSSKLYEIKYVQLYLVVFCA